jgi:hypothetical protein
MNGYRVTFFKHLVNSDGHQFKCSQGVVMIHHAKTKERALRAAQRRFERSLKSAWCLHADFAAIEPIIRES